MIILQGLILAPNRSRALIQLLFAVGSDELLDDVKFEIAGDVLIDGVQERLMRK